MGLSITEVSQTSFRTTREADDLNDKLQRVLGMPHRYGPARLAIARSLASEKAPEPHSIRGVDQGRTIRGDPLFGSDADLGAWTALLIERAGADLSRRELQELVSAHWHRGIKLIWKEWQATERDYDRFIGRLCEEADLKEQGDTLPPSGEDHHGGAPPHDEPIPRPVDLQLGDPATDISTNEPAVWRINGRGNSPHIAVMGTLGTGKTRLAMELVENAQAASNCAVLMFDMGKGDLAENTDLVRRLNAHVVPSPEEPVPLDVLNFMGSSESALNTAALRFRESFSNACKSRPGAMQLDALREAAKTALQGKPPTSIADVYDALKAHYQETERKEDIITATFNEFCAYKLFEPVYRPEDFFRRNWIIDVHTAPESVQRLVVLLVLDAADAYLKRLKDAPIDADGNRAMRIVLVIDEARRVLGYQQTSLIELVRTSRSKGASVVMISQSPDDFSRQQENFLENVGLTISFRTNASNNRVLNAIFGQNVDLAGLPNGICVTRLPDKPGVRRIRAWQ